MFGASPAATGGSFDKGFSVVARIYAVTESRERREIVGPTSSSLSSVISERFGSLVDSTVGAGDEKSRDEAMTRGLTDKPSLIRSAQRFAR